MLLKLDNGEQYLLYPYKHHQTKVFDIPLLTLYNQSGLSVKLFG